MSDGTWSSEVAVRAALAPRLPRGAVADFAAAHGVTPRVVADARALRRISTEHLIVLCAATGLSPATAADLAPDEARRRGPIEWRFLALALALRQEAEQRTLRRIADCAGFSASTLCRVRQGTAISAEFYLRLCAWLGLHPNAATAPMAPAAGPAAPRETAAETGAAA